MTKPLRIAWLAPYPVSTLKPGVRLSRTPAQEHSCSWIVNLASALSQKQDVELHLVTESTCLARPQEARQDGIVYHVMPSGLAVIGRGLPSWLPLEALTGFRRRARRLARLIQVLQPDLVHAHGTEAAYARAACLSPFPCLISIQGVITEYCKAEPCVAYRILRHWEQYVVRRCQFFTCRTNFDNGFIREYNPTARIFDIAEAMHPVFFEREWQPPTDPIILFVGSFAARKGLDLLLRAFALVRPRLPHARLLVVGGSTGSQPSGLVRLIRDLRVESAVEFLGRQTAREIAAIQQRAQVFVLPSRIENSPNSLAEAMVAGLPVVATAVGGVPSMIREAETGWLVPPSSPNELAERLVWVLQHPAEAKTVGDRARLVARAQHHPETVAAQTLLAYREILSTHQRPRSA